MFGPFRKEKPLPSLIGMGGGAQSLVTISAGGDGPIEATGGDTVSTYPSGSDTYKYHLFTNPGSFSVSAAPPDATIELMVIGGGGGGGGVRAGGGGAGAVQWRKAFPVSASPGSYSVTRGNGGANAGTSEARGSDGTASSFGPITAPGGGGGGTTNPGPPTGGGLVGKSGGSGGGGGGNSGGGGPGPSTGDPFPGNLADGDSPTNGFGHDGGEGRDASPAVGGGGGGGAGGAGTDGSNPTTGAGGASITWDGTGSSVDYAGGGSGGGWGGTVGPSPPSGGEGRAGGNAASDGGANTGGGGGGGGQTGGGGSGSEPGGSGGTGVVLLRYLFN